MWLHQCWPHGSGDVCKDIWIFFFVFTTLLICAPVGFYNECFHTFSMLHGCAYAKNILECVWVRRVVWVPWHHTPLTFNLLNCSFSVLFLSPSFSDSQCFIPQGCILGLLHFLLYTLLTRRSHQCLWQLLYVKDAQSLALAHIWNCFPDSRLVKQTRYTHLDVSKAS